MTIKNLYKITRPDGGTTVTPNQPTGMSYVLMYRLIADDGKILTDGDTQTCCIDINTDEVDRWSEIDDPDQEA